MIKDLLKNAKTYYLLSENLKKGLVWLENTDLLNLNEGIYEIYGKKVYANVQEYKTKIDAKYENHRNYIDIQVVIKGKEKVGVTNISNCTSCIPYDSEKDLEFFDIKEEDNEEFLNLYEGDFLVLFPQDAHKPSIAIDTPSFVKKVVVKVSVD